MLAGALSVTSSTFTGNHAGGLTGPGTFSGVGVGGAIDALDSGGVTLVNDTFAGNRAEGDGKGGTLELALPRARASSTTRWPAARPPPEGTSTPSGGRSR